MQNLRRGSPSLQGVRGIAAAGRLGHGGGLAVLGVSPHEQRL
jgi:hypothetical protein